MCKNRETRKIWNGAGRLKGELNAKGEIETENSWQGVNIDVSFVGEREKNSNGAMISD